MNILVTGVNGFVGQALSTRMLAEGWRVRGTVRDSEDFKKLPA